MEMEKHRHREKIYECKEARRSMTHRQLTKESKCPVYRGIDEIWR